MENQRSLFCDKEEDHRFRIISHSCEIEVIIDDFDRHYKGTSTLVVLCTICGQEVTQVEESETESYIL